MTIHRCHYSNVAFEEFAVQKGLCIAALTISALVFVFFLLDLIMGFAGAEQLAPFKNASLWIDIVFLVASSILGVMSYFTFRKQV